MNIKLKDIDHMVFVATCPRSGSSMLSGILERCGAFGGQTNGPTSWNKRGQYENQAIRSIAFKPIMDLHGTKIPAELIKKTDDFGVSFSEQIKKDITYVFNRQGYKSGVAYFKGGPYMFLFDAIYDAFPDSTWILPKRNRGTVIKSMKRAGYPRDNRDINLDINSYYDMYEKIKSKAANVFEINTDDIVSGDVSEMTNLIQHLGLKWNSESVSEWITPEMFTQKECNATT